MKYSTIAKVFMVVLVLSMAATTLWAAGTTEPTAAVDKKYVTDPTNGKVVVAPEYGGTITAANDRNIANADQSIGGIGSGYAVGGVIEKLGIANWAIDRSINSLSNEFLDTSHYAGALAESWEVPDNLTYIFHIRQGVKWQDKAPMNGREFTAEDVVFNFHRYTATGSGFTELQPNSGQLAEMKYASIEATDKYTVVIKLTQPRLDALNLFIDDNYAFMNAPEVIKQYGDVSDWRNLVGTGPFELVDWVEGSSLTWKRNPNYWGHDEKYPENQLPYVDELRHLLIKDYATMFAGMRTGKIDYMAHNVSTMVQSIDQAAGLQKTNPELRQNPYFFRSNVSFALIVDEPPFDDIRVRKAMQMAINLEEINNGFFRGLGRPTPQGLVGSVQKTYSTPFEEWPEDVKESYGYDPEGAKQLLAEAGYPNGFDTTMEIGGGANVPLCEIAVDYWRKIGVDVQINSFESSTLATRWREGKSEGMILTQSGTPYRPLISLAWQTTGHRSNKYALSDPIYDAMYEKASSTGSEDELKKIAKEMNMYIVENQWITWLPIQPWFNITQPYLTGFDGDFYMGVWNKNAIFARLWIDSEMKAAMGF